MLIPVCTGVHEILRDCGSKKETVYITLHGGHSFEGVVAAVGSDWAYIPDSARRTNVYEQWVRIDDIAAIQVVNIDKRGG